MTSERWKQILFAHVSDETVQDMLSKYVLELESSNAKLRELVRVMAYCMQDESDCDRCAMNGADMELSIGPLFACDTLRDMLLDMGMEAEQWASLTS